jgi:chaperonin GroES
MGDYCIVAPVVFKDTNDDSTGIVNPSQYEDKNEYGVVLSTGAGRVTENGSTVYSQAFVGDTVLYGQYAYSQIRINGMDLNIIRHDDIIAVLPRK